MELLKKVRDALLSAMPEGKVFHYWAMGKEPPYCLWLEDGAISLRSDNRTENQAFTGTAHLFTLTEYDPLFTAIQTAFDDAAISWYFNSAQYEEDTKYFHYEWVWSVG